MRTKKEMYDALRKWGHGRKDAKAIAKGLMAWVNKPDLEESDKKEGEDAV